MNGLDLLIEQQIAKAQSEGLFEDLEGAGKPLPKRNPHVDPMEEFLYRMMAENGAVPQEIELKKQVDQLNEQLAQVTDKAERKGIMRQIADLQLKIDMEREARLKLARHK
ncbi:DUF1992 domain-containing protein [Polycladidibacter hongkongensis]|uniref:DnaJ family domain-containing protein n=1 Tax=Polycladidibacter hongkongensis TaxID=1647556 RepID=UPI000837594C|nr:DUF1992 domain-containing protein [Pseudovibrio hongkongensis]